PRRGNTMDATTMEKDCRYLGRFALAAVVTGLALVVGGCAGDEEGQESPPATTQPASPSAPAETPGPPEETTSAVVPEPEHEPQPQPQPESPAPAPQPAPATQQAPAPQPAPATRQAPAPQPAPEPQQQAPTLPDPGFEPRPGY